MNSREETVRLSGFGAFEAKDRPARSGRDPRTGAPLAVAGQPTSRSGDTVMVSVIPRMSR